MSRETGAGHLWAVGYADMGRANQVKDEIIRLGWDEPYLFLSDVAVVVRHPDGSFTLNREPFPAGPNILGCTTVGFIAGLVLGVPLTGAAVGALLGGVGTGVNAAVGIADDFVPQHSRARGDGAEDERRCEAGEADSGDPDRGSGALKKDMISLLFIFFALDAVAFAAPGEDALSQKAVEIARPFGFPITNSMVVMWIVAVGLILFAQIATRTMKEVPEGSQNFLEFLTLLGGHDGVLCLLGRLRGGSGDGECHSSRPHLVLECVAVGLHSFGGLSAVGWRGSDADTAHHLAQHRGVGERLGWSTSAEVVHEHSDLGVTKAVHGHEPAPAGLARDREATGGRFRHPVVLAQRRLGVRHLQSLGRLLLACLPAPIVAGGRRHVRVAGELLHRHEVDPGGEEVADEGPAPRPPARCASAG